MCRWFSYISEEPVLIADVLIRPKHSIIKQIDTHFLPGAHIATDSGSPNPLSNLDGFGLGWYTPSWNAYDLSTSNTYEMPALYKSVRPPLNDLNLQSLATNTETKCLVSHVRAGTGLTPVVETANHPFVFGRFLFAHNGVVGRFFDIKVKLLGLLSPAARMNVLGTTDTEHLAALFFTHLDPDGPWTGSYSPTALQSALRGAILDIENLISSVGGYNSTSTHSALNLVITDGTQLLATRYAYPVGREPPSLYVSTEAGPTLNRKFPGHPDGPREGEVLGARRKREEHGKSVIVASEPVTWKKEEWTLMEPNTLVFVGKNLNVTSQKI